MSYYAQSKLTNATRAFCEGPFDTYKQAATCARINARKLRMTIEVVRINNTNRQAAEEMAS